jgi:hypothetical protein
VETRRNMKRLGVTRAEVYGECSKMDTDGGDGEIDAEVNMPASFKSTEGPLRRRRNTGRCYSISVCGVDGTMRNTMCGLEALL